MKNVQYIKTVKEYKEKISQLHDWIASEKLIDENATILVYRGHSSSKYALIPSIARPIVAEKRTKWLKEERELVKKAQIYYSKHFENLDNHVELLTILQHYGLPTRLLDVTECKLVALYFACCNRFDQKGEVFIMKADRVIPDHNLYQAVGASWKLLEKGDYVRDIVDKMTREPFYREDNTPFNQLEESDVMGNNLQIIQYRAKHYVFPKRLTPRQEAQKGRYLLFSNNTDRHTGAIKDRISEINKTSSMILMRFIIEPEHKINLLKELENLGIDKQHLFPDDEIQLFKSIKQEIEEKYR